MQVKTQKQVTVLQNKAQKVADKLNEEGIVIDKINQLHKQQNSCQK
jgi:hypothetical protein